MTHPPSVAIVGSINMDLVARVKRLPRPGETVVGEQLLQIPGGKGANQAVAAAQMETRAVMIGRVGDDAFGEGLLRSLEGSGVVIDHVEATADCSSGVALIGVQSNGENAITIVGGANARLTADDLSAVEAVIAKCQVLALQLEIPVETVEAALKIAARHQVITMLDPAPAPAGDLPPALFEVDVLAPNQGEAEALTGERIDGLDDAKRAARLMHERGARWVIIKLGPEGALLSDRDTGSALHQPAPAVDVVDTTAAGDAFAGALASELARGVDIAIALRTACAAGALATTRFGAQPAMPSAEAVRGLLGATLRSRIL